MTGSKDWHTADIIAAIRKKGTTMAAVSRDAGLSSSTLSNALARPWPKGEMIIARAIGIEEKEIWPSWYRDAKTGIVITRKLRS
ncbi:helix-turn-helix domain-containing protein [Rahnella woolbedingensis]|uniref:Transcriptional regulator n=1 Tax=Rahnella woolbedingensis TaxID=1510574 RepID=A0A419NCN6_9GAMM|nr:helix-turn-helix transcriptional regulator [Rahnella woolbedingensis]RJT46103.1 transcriptional regulator [Rahnella woolbedingensis]